LLWQEPRPTPPVPSPWWDWGLAVVVVTSGLLEGAFREHVVWRPLSVLMVVVTGLLLPWRRKYPFPVFVAVIGTSQVLNLGAVLVDVQWTALHSSAWVLLLPYALFRWGAGRENVMGGLLMMTAYAVGLFSGETQTMTDVIGGAVVFSFPAVLGASARSRATAQLRELDKAKLLERQRLARELHDSVAHHVSAIIIQAQAGRAVAAARPEEAAAVLKVIEDEARRTLSEMRGIVGALRDHDDAARTPQAGLADIEQLAQGRSGKLPVELELSGDLGSLTPTVAAALYRLAQETITNATRHARNASLIVVRVTGEESVVRLTVHDDGDPPLFAARARGGFGLVGMAERAALLGGTFQAGPDKVRGWTVEAVLPRNGAAP